MFLTKFTNSNTFSYISLQFKTAFFSLYLQQISDIKNIKYGFIIYPISIFILLFNLLGLLPYNYTVTSNLFSTICLSSSFFFGVLFISLTNFKLKFFQLFLPESAYSNKALLFLLFFIELVSYFSRLFSLAIRLFANIVAGHILLKILVKLLIDLFPLNFEFSIFNIKQSFMYLWEYFTFYILIFVFFAKFVFYGIINLFFTLELGVSCLQVYIFVILCMIYLQNNLNPVH